MRRFTILAVISLVGILYVARQDKGAQTLGEAEALKFMQLEGQVPLGRVLMLADVATEAGPGKIWICSDLDCPEGCNSQNPAWGNGLVLEESRRLQGK
jgi:hypothetical protein